MECKGQGILFDHDRPGRIGLPEAVLSEGKTPEALAGLLAAFRKGCGRPVLFTRLSPDVFGSLDADLRASYDYDPVSRTAFGERLPARDPSLDAAVVSAGTSDAPVSRECARTLSYLGFKAVLYEDSGVAGLWRLSGRLEAINSHKVVVAVAGLDAALASVLGGLTPRPVVAVPTSTGYGLARGGESALASMLLSCSPGITVVNIDNGYGAACAAARILNLLDSGSAGGSAGQAAGV
ncbi:MAG: nickel pincer cofactor biosynthesis protein LarB [Deltaproteobacteria bacterium]|jgi:NCAIR mutase (PurE)-related protein|nr:nickel pincer cofactor biosynthesis protein LarB [Deltaproteobacteria bacterium]